MRFDLHVLLVKLPPLLGEQFPGLCFAKFARLRELAQLLATLVKRGFLRDQFLLSFRSVHVELFDLLFRSLDKRSRCLHSESGERLEGQGKLSQDRFLTDVYSHLEIDEKFLAWVKQGRILEAGHIVIEWVDSNPMAHNDPNYAPVGKFMFTPLDQYVELLSRV